jgi:GTP pyrophosphokinase
MMKQKKYSFTSGLKEILERIESYYPAFGERQKNLIKKAYKYGKNAHEGQWRESGYPYFSHAVEATKILLSIKPDIETVIACLLHDVLEDTPVTADELEEVFGSKIRFLCEGVEKISKVHLKKNEGTARSENIQKLFVAIAQDIRVIFVKLADRIHNLETLGFVAEEKRERIAHESLQIYAPVADNFGLFEFKTKISDLCFKHLFPQIYKNLETEISQSKKQKIGFLDRIKKEIMKASQKNDINILQIKGRQKNLASVYNKMKQKNYFSVLEVYDLFGLRILVKTKDDCYRVLGVLHTYWTPMPNRFKDYISVPKPNGYQSLHTTLLGLGGSKLPTEIQIRTKQMHQDAEFGPAAHWAYKKTQHSYFDEDYLRRTNWFPHSISQESRRTPEKFFEKISQTILADRVYVFTPKGDIEIFPIHSTPVDFAYSIHSDVGDTCVGARINGTIKPLDYELQNGDIVEILTKEGRKPNPAWLDFVKSSHARSHIRSFLNKEKETKKEEVELKRKKPISRSRSNRLFRSLSKTGRTTLVIGGERDIPYKLASCCTPQPEQNIIAYKSRSPHFTIHRADCQQLNRLDPERFLEAHFVIENKFEIHAFDRIGLLRDISAIIADQGLNIGELNSHYEYKEEKRVSIWNFSLESASQSEMDTIIKKLKSIQNIFLVKQLT